jgi:ribosomal protein L37AE/L43A
MTDRRPKHQCPICKAKVRLIGKHMNQKHQCPICKAKVRLIGKHMNQKHPTDD